PHLSRLENTRSFVDADQVRAWCGAPGTTVTVRPVLELADHLSSSAYEAPSGWPKLETHTAWHYVMLERGSYLWTSPHGYQFLRDHDGTLDVTAATEPRRPTGGHLLVVPDP
ncbi:MAG: hypothetical protein WBQ50_20745, partial [Nocardioides sp.]